MVLDPRSGQLHPKSREGEKRKKKEEEGRKEEKKEGEKKRQKEGFLCQRAPTKVIKHSDGRGRVAPEVGAAG